MRQPPPSEPIRAALAQCRAHFSAAAGFSVLVNLLYIVPTLYMLQVYDRVVPTQGVKTLAFLTLALLLGLAALTVLDRIRLRLLVRAGYKLETTLAPLVLDATLGRPDLPVARAALRDFDTLRAVLTGPGILALFDAPWVPIYILVCFLVHPWIGGVAIIGCLLLPLITWITESSTRRQIDKAQAIAASSVAHQDMLLNAADSLRALGMRRAMVARQIRQRATMLQAQTETSLSSGNFYTIGKFVRLALQSLALGLGALLAIDNLISGGAIFAASFLIARALQPIEQLIGSWKSIVQARYSYRSLNSLLLTAPPTIARTTLPALTGAISAEGVTVFSDARDAALLHSISFTIAPGEIVAVLGASGAGKSTLLRVLAGALLPESGTIRFDGSNARDWDAELLASHIGYVPQDAVLFPGSVAENIARFAGETGMTRGDVDTAVVAAAKKVGADALIRRLPGGYDHPLAGGGRGVSAGQGQRIALARAAYGDPAVLLLDEPNAHLDAEGDAALAATLERLKKEKRTVLIASHKLGVLPVVDRIMVLRGGRIELFNTREEVLARIAPPGPRRVPSPPAVQTQ